MMERTKWLLIALIFILAMVSCNEQVAQYDGRPVYRPRPENITYYEINGHRYIRVSQWDNLNHDPDCDHWKHRVNECAIDLPEEDEAISHSPEHPDTVVIYKWKDTLRVEFFQR